MKSAKYSKPFWFSLLLTVLLGCSSMKAAGAKKESHSSVHHAYQSTIEMLNPNAKSFDPEKGRMALEQILKSGQVKTVEVPATVLLELLRTEKVAVEKTKSLETQIEVMKEIDLKHVGK